MDAPPCASASVIGDLSSSSGKSKSSTATYAAALVSLIAIHVRDPGWGIWNIVRVAGSLVLGAGLAYKGGVGRSIDRSVFRSFILSVGRSLDWSSTLAPHS